MKKRFYKSKRLWAAFGLLIAVIWVVQRPVLSEFVAFTTEVLCARRGVEFHAESVRAGLFEPIVMRGVVLGVKSKANSSQSTVEVESITLEWQDPLTWFSDRGRWVHSIEMSQLLVFIDFRREETGRVSDYAMRPLEFLATFTALGGSWPEKIGLENAAIELMSDSTRLVMNGGRLSLGESEAGLFSLDSLTIQSNRFERVFGPLSAKAAWDGTRISLAGLEILTGVMMNEISCELPIGGEPALSFNGRFFGGTIRGDWSFQRGAGGPFWDFAAICSHVNLEEIPSLFGLGGKAKGILSEGRFTYRGEPNRPADAEASLRVLAKDFRWNDRGWESLEVGASLIHRRLFVSNFDLRQKENKVSLNGEISLAEGWAKITEAAFLLNLRANIKELGSVAILTGPGIEEINGELEANGSLSGRLGSLDGFVGIKAKGIEFRGATVDQAALEILFRKTTAEIVKCEMTSRDDKLQATGSIGISSPHPYSASLDASLSDLATWLRPFPKLGGGVVSSGALKVAWKGEGSINGHSGEFQTSLSKFVTTYTPVGLTGHFAGTYSPENIHFSKALLENGNLRMQSRITLSSSGLNFEDLQLNANEKTLLHGKLFLPLNPFTISAQTDWKSAILASHATYLEANTPGELAVEDLVKLAGQNWPVRGFLKMKLEAYGPAEEITGKLSLDAREVFFGKYPATNPSNLRVTVDTSAGRATLEGEVLNPSMNPLRLTASFPLALQKSGEGSMQWIPGDAAIQALLDFPRADLALLRPFLSNLQDLSGELSGRLNITGSLNDPKADGSMEIRNASFHLGSLASSAEFVTGQLQIENSSLQIKSLAGEIEPGRFELSGVCHFPAPWKPAWNLTLRGERIPVLVDSLSTLLVEGELQASGGAESGSITGECRFVDSVVRRQIEVLPLFSATGSPSLGLESHAAIIQNLAPYPHWSIQLKIGGEDPIRLTGQNLAGSIFPDLAILGTVDRPVPVGTISVAGLEVKTPAGPLFSERAEICFYPDQPWQPFVYARATGFFAGSIVEATAFGPLSEGKWCLRSMDPDPLLPQAVTMLLRGGAPAFLMPAGLLGPSEFFLMTENQKHSLQPVALRIEDQTLVGGGMRFPDSMDFSLRGALLPAGSFEQGFQWRWIPAF